MSAVTFEGLSLDARYAVHVVHDVGSKPATTGRSPFKQARSGHGTSSAHVGKEKDATDFDGAAFTVSQTSSARAISVRY